MIVGVRLAACRGIAIKGCLKSSLDSAPRRSDRRRLVEYADGEEKPGGWGRCVKKRKYVPTAHWHHDSPGLGVHSAENPFGIHMLLRTGCGAAMIQNAWRSFDRRFEKKFAKSMGTLDWGWAFQTIYHYNTSRKDRRGFAEFAESKVKP